MYWFMRVLKAVGEAAERRPAAALAVVFLPYLLFAGGTAVVKPLWVDEQYTYFVARAGGLGEIWAALLATVDNHPPLDYWLRHLAMRVFGSGELAFRSVSLVAFWLGVWCLYRFVRRRTGAIYGLVALLVPFSTLTYELAYEGRYQALVFACAGLSLLSWQAAAEGSRAWAAILAASLAAGIYADYNAVLLFAPVVVGEAVRNLYNRRLDKRVWVALAAAAASLAGLLPLIEAVRQFAGGFWTPTSLMHALDIYASLFARAVTAAGAFAATLLVLPRNNRLPETEGRAGPPPHEMAAAAAYLLLPVFCYLLANLATGALHWRYTAPAVLGAGAMAAYAARRLAVLFPFAPAALVLCLYVNALGNEAGNLQRNRRYRADVAPGNLAALLPPAGVPVVMGYTDWSFRMLHYAPAEIRERVVYLFDTDAARQAMGTDTAERGLAGLRGWSPFHNIQPFSGFVRANDRFWLLEAGVPQRWLVSRLLESGAVLTVRGVYRGDPVYEVRLR